MADLSTTYMGLPLRNPVIVSSSSLTGTVAKVKQCADHGAGAVVLKSIFEEQIAAHVSNLLKEGEPSLMHPEAAGYITRYGQEGAVNAHLQLIRESKAAVSIPVIGSIHCVSAGKWTDFATQVEQAGADALELNVFILPSNARRGGEEIENIYFDLAEAVAKKISIPVSLKIGSYFSGLSNTILRLSRRGLGGLVLFNRFYNLDFDIEKMEIIPAGYLSSPAETVIPLRWISILSEEAGCDLAATTGVHDGEAVIKHLLAGAAAVQVCSTLYENGVHHLEQILRDVEEWMTRHKHEKIADFRGKMSQGKSENPADYERVQFMKTSVGIE
jgi:dihydroorotate dehydrogenase (fumarate)